ncbi:WD repeat domain-containing protein 83 [Biomphalaria pfeifferi]|uniref:WD repeat domain-containing protein 83 n=1 Tax=Biomphalaria pfeifferi TaxID=112525 RepID=A0AAD8CBI8_BIOPF|nr:WD repeat domain-containing protein 83 [Biomphalaria pfeifferi]
MAWPNKRTQIIDCKQGAVRCVKFNVDGNYCLTCGSDKTVKLWNPHKNLLLKTYIGHGYEVLDAHSSGDNAHICSGGMDKAVVLFDVSTGQTVRKFRDHAGTVNTVCFNEESTVILSGSIDCSVRAWDIRSKKHEPIQILNEAKDSVTSVQVSDHEILSGSADSKVRRYDLRMGKMFSDYVGKPISCVRFTRDSQCVLVSSTDTTVKLIDKDSGEMLNQYQGHKNVSYKIDCCLNHQDTQVLSGSEDGKVFIWDLVEAKLVDTLNHETSRTIHSLSFHPSEPLLLTACADKVFVWESNH